MRPYGYRNAGRLTRREMFLALGAGAATGGCGRIPGGSTRPRRRHELILCGWDEVFILSVQPGKDPAPEKIWSWRAAACPNLPEAMHSKFRSTDECKPIDGGRKILITSSSTGVALVERATKRALFHATVTNAHSAEFLPNNRIVVASSVSAPGTGNLLVLFNAAESEKELFSDELRSAHGVVWDAKRKILWALGYDELRAYRLEEWDSDAPRLKRVATYSTPDGGGHDLSPIPGTPQLFISTNEHCWYFNRDTREFAPHDILADAERVKGYSIHPATGRIAYIQAEGGNWWSEHVHLLRPEATVHLPGEHLYKARWNTSI